MFYRYQFLYRPCVCTFTVGKQLPDETHRQHTLCKIRPSHRIRHQSGSAAARTHSRQRVAEVDWYPVLLHLSKAQWHCEAPLSAADTVPMPFILNRTDTASFPQDRCVSTALHGVTSRISQSTPQHVSVRPILILSLLCAHVSQGTSSV